MKTKDLTGKKFGKLTVIKFHHTNHNKYWLCKCECGNETIVRGSSLTNGGTTSCGCGKQQLNGASKERLYSVYNSMIQRCENPKSNRYNNYGGRGIKVCDEWKNNYFAFRKWAYENGYNENATYGKCTIDRIDVNGNYEPDNCRFVDMKTQAHNRNSNVKIKYNGEIHTLTEWANILDVTPTTLFHRYERGWSVDNMLKPNVRNEIVLTYNNKTHTLSEWSKLLNINYKTLQYRYYKGRTDEQILSAPVRYRQTIKN